MTDTTQPDKRPWRRRTVVVAVYVALVVASTFVRMSAQPKAIPADVKTVVVKTIVGDDQIDRDVRMAYREYGNPVNPTLVVLHGSPGSSSDVARLAYEFADRYRVVVPDMPGFGDSISKVPDYSIRAHAFYVLELLDRLGIEKFHVLSFSMGGGVGLNLTDIAPERVRSVVMLSAIGVQEMELLGDYHMNHAIHGAQLAGLWALRELTPHFGYLDDAVLSVEYARNFYDSDQRPLRGELERYAGPMLIIHGEEDPLVPIQAAREHARVVPQSELVVLDDNHFMVFTHPADPARIALSFLDRVERGDAATRQTASAERISRAAAPLDPADLPRAMGVAALVVGVLLAVSTLVSEDLTCIGAGVMAAQGRIGFGLAVVACLLGIFVGDILLFLAGRWLGRPALRRAPLKWFVRERDVERCSAWFNRRGAWAIILSRFIPGTRLPTYFAAGVLDTSLIRFSVIFLLASIVWTPVLVGVAMLIGGEVLERFLAAGHQAFLGGIAAIVVGYFVVRLLVSLVTYRGRRLLVGKLKRTLQWEFWPPWVFYPPVLVYVAWCAVKHRSLTVFTLANPGIWHGGFVGESKWEILEAIADFGGAVALSQVLGVEHPVAERMECFRAFCRDRALTFPIVLKPDVGQRGDGVVIAHSDDDVEQYLAGAEGDVIVQEYVPGAEFGVFYVRQPGADVGRIFAITDKRFPTVVGDGVSTLERLILTDPRAVCMARVYFEVHGDRIWDVVPRGETVRLVDLGTHCRGAIFLDGMWVATPDLEREIDRISKRFDGFYFGRYDIRVPDLAAFQRGEGFKVVELNGVTSEATSIYDPKNSVFAAWRTIFEQWRLAFEIGAAVRATGKKPAPARELVGEILHFWRGSAAAPHRLAARRQNEPANSLQSDLNNA